MLKTSLVTDLFSHRLRGFIHKCSTGAVLCALVAFSAYAANPDWENYSTSDGSTPTARHEAGGLVIGNKLYAMGGRGDRPVERLNTQTGKWEFLANAPVEMHHFQPVEWGGKIYVIGAFTCCYPIEDNIENIWIFDPQDKSWTEGPEIPSGRVRGSTGAAVYNDKIYIVGGNTKGHDDGAVNWFDEYDPATNTWREMPDAPNARDHFTVAIVGDRLVAAAGRRSVQPGSELRKFNIEPVDVFDFGSNKWVNGYDDIPTPRAGTVSVPYKREVIVTGGETVVRDAEKTVEALDVDTGTWRTLDDMNFARHGHVGGVIGDVLYMSCGNELRGGGAELDNTETLDLGSSGGSSDSDGDGLSDDDETGTHGTDPNQADTDSDALTDGDEVLVYNTDPLDSDSDDDLLTDGAEINQHETDPLAADSDGDSLSDSDEIIDHGTDPNNADTDGDSLADAAEINQHQTDPLKADTDADTLSDAAEINTHSTDPLKQDTDGDTLDDAAELQAGTNPLSADTDQDGDADNVEIANGTDPLDADDNSGVTNPDPGEPAPGGSGNPGSGTATSGGGALSFWLLLLALTSSRISVSLRQVFHR